MRSSVALFRGCVTSSSSLISQQTMWHGLVELDLSHNMLYKAPELFESLACLGGHLQRLDVSANSLAGEVRNLRSNSPDTQSLLLFGFEQPALVVITYLRCVCLSFLFFNN